MAVKMNVVGGALTQGGKLQPFVADKGDPGAPGAAGAPSTVAGPEGNDGWTPILAGEADGTRTLIKVVDWTGGEGTKPATGMYIGATGYVATKALAFNFNAIKRVFPMSAVTNASGIATFNLTPYGFTAIPQVIPLPATTAVISGATRSVVTGTTTLTQAQVKVDQAGLLTGAVTLLVGATSNVLIIEQ
ncbi:MULTISPECIES: hypothetical protein [unclassified Novosphingobium]|uniref:hypothetical protein n=1 Tax=unclassified Novosphingobium TaxID=2644732 RepID=UPI001358897E|nr:MULTISPECIES: hypothetical protein [unclassified Novosphingobium]